MQRRAGESLVARGVMLATLGAGLLVPAVAQAQNAPRDPVAVAIERGASDGPVIDGYGRVFRVDDPDLAFAPSGDTYKVVFEISEGASSPERPNTKIANVARFLNMHGGAGVPTGNMHLAVVLHGSASWEALDDEGYQAKYGMNNPSRPLLDALAAAGVRIYLCSQSAAGRGLEKARLAPPVSLAFSAMTAIVSLQAQGYAHISHDWPR